MYISGKLSIMLLTNWIIILWELRQAAFEKHASKIRIVKTRGFHISIFTPTRARTIIFNLYATTHFRNVVSNNSKQNWDWSEITVSTEIHSTLVLRFCVECELANQNCVSQQTVSLLQTFNVHFTAFPLF